MGMLKFGLGIRTRRVPDITFKVKGARLVLYVRLRSGIYLIFLTLVIFSKVFSDKIFQKHFSNQEGFLTAFILSSHNSFVADVTHAEDNDSKIE